MNGVRRFFAATNATTSSSPPPSAATEPIAEPAASPPKPPPLQTVLPLSIGSGKQLFPPQSETNSPVQASSPPTSPGTAAAGLFIRKDAAGSPRRKPVMSPTSSDSKTLPPKPSTSSTSPPSASARKPVRAMTPPVGSTTSSANNSPNLPPPSRVVDLSKQSASTLENGWRKTSMLVNTRDDLLMSLLASEAVVDSRGFEILSAEEVEELKREQQLLSSRLVAMRKKVALETKIRDAALNLQKLQTVKRLSKQTSEQVDAGNRKVDIATKELSRLLERASDVDRKLLEHRAGVLSFSVRNLEAKLSPGNVICESTDESTSISGGRNTSQELNSPTSSVTSMSTRAKFDGAHLFAGHADTIIPGFSRKTVNSAQVAALEEKLKTAEESLETAEARSSEMQKQIKLLQLEKSDVEATLNLDLQTAEETISKLEREMTEMENTDRDREAWDQERQSLKEDLKSRANMIQQLERRVRELETVATRSDTLENAILAKDEEIRHLRNDAERERAQWERQRSQSEQEKREEMQRIRGDFGNLQVITEQLDAGRDALRSVVRSHRVVTSPGDTSFPSLAASLGAHIATLDSKLIQSDQEKSELEALRRRYEEDVRNGLEIRERLGREVEEARREREEARKEVRLLENRIKEQSDRVLELANVRASATDNKSSEEYLKVLASLRGLWAVLPSVETRASKMGKSNTLAPGSPGGSPSLSDLDVRALKSLYDPKSGFSSPTLSGEFSVDEFVTRVQALIADDRALVERLIRFAQSHDLLRNNAERAQKLAQDSNKGLEMYQSQVKALEERNTTLSNKQLSMLDEINALQQAVDRALQEKRDLESQTIEMGENLQNLTEANNKLSARALAFAEEAAAAPNAMKTKLESQLSEVRTKLEEAQDEIERMRSSESTQRVALLDELNSLQQENGRLRDQLRAKK